MAGALVTQSSQEAGPFCLSTSGASFRCVCVIELHGLVVKCRAEFVQETVVCGLLHLSLAGSAVWRGKKTFTLFLETQTCHDRVQTNPRVVLNPGEGTRRRGEVHGNECGTMSIYIISKGEVYLYAYHNLKIFIKRPKIDLMVCNVA